MEPRASHSPELTPEPRMLGWLRDGGQVDALFAEVERRERQRRHKRLRIAGAAAAVCALAMLFWAVPQVRDTRSVATDAARRQSLALMDGSQAELNARTRIFTDYRGNRRRVRLEQGEAFFEVARDPARPFIVDTPAGRVRVTGTKFNVRLTPDGDAEVTLLEGSVEFQLPELSALSHSGVGTAERRSPAPMQLAPGQQVDSGAGTLRTLSSEEIEDVTAWRQGRAVFHGATLEKVIERFARYHGKSIRLAPKVCSLRVGGSFMLDDLPGFLGAIEEMLPVRVFSLEDGSYRVFNR